jgi:hypothetical protein
MGSLIIAISIKSNKEDLWNIIWINRKIVLLNMDILRYFDMRSSSGCRRCIFVLFVPVMLGMSNGNEVKLVQ